MKVKRLYMINAELFINEMINKLISKNISYEYIDNEDICELHFLDYIVFITKIKDNTITFMSDININNMFKEIEESIVNDISKSKSSNKTKIYLKNSIKYDNKKSNSKIKTKLYKSMIKRHFS